jgi:hypothetical protein
MARPVHFVLLSPVNIPQQPAGAGPWFLDVDEAAPHPKLIWRARADFPTAIQSSTGKRGKLIREVVRRIADLPEFGKTTLTLEVKILVDGSDVPVDQWDESDWQVKL